MPRSVPLRLTPFLVGLAACAGGALANSYSTSSAAPAPDLYACAREQLKAVGFRQNSHDDTDLRLTAHKYQEDVRRPDVTFRRLVDRLEIQAEPASDGMSSLRVEAATYAERTTHRGPTEEQEKTSEQARTAAQTILDRCATR